MMNLQHHMLLSIFVNCLFNWLLASCHQEYQTQIPNGAVVPSPCGGTWPGVGHQPILGSGPLNPFGRDYLANGKKYDRKLCLKDSDGDGKSNGVELGDPNCVWTVGATPAVTDQTKLSHPGVCEPIDSPQCVSKNAFLNEIAACKKMLNQTVEDWCPYIREPDVKNLTLRYSEFVLPTTSESLYYCQKFSVPDDQDYHIIAYEPVISNREIMHHLILFICDTPEQEQELARSGAYKTMEECGMVPKGCVSSTVGWAFGSDGGCYENTTGVVMGKGSYKTVILQIHYNNAMLKKNLSDSSGLTLYYTAKKRQYDIAQIEVGQIDIAIPPKSRQLTRVTAKAFQSSTCSFQQLAPYQSYNITSLFIHMHKQGVHAKVTLKKRSGQVVKIFDDDCTYDVPPTLDWPLSQALVLEAGDNIELECTYKSDDREDWTFFGKNTTDEMCLVYLDVSPRPQNRNSLTLDNMGRFDVCTMNQTVIEGCPVVEFATNMTIWESSIEGGLMTYCNDPALGYPAYSCSYTCYNFLKSKQLFDHSCMKGTTFHLVASYVISDLMADIYQIRSQAERCAALTKPPVKSAKDQIVLDAVAVAKTLAGEDKTVRSQAAAENYSSRSQFLLFAMLLAQICLFQ